MLKYAKIIAVCVCLLPVTGFSLGLGELYLHSSLNQPLDADVELLAIEKVDLEQIRIALGSAEDFTRSGIDRPFFLTKFLFSTVVKADGSAFVRITSKEVIKEPFIDFILDVTWPRGRLLREYTMLLDPPVFVDDETMPDVTPASSMPVNKAPADDMQISSTTIPRQAAVPVEESPRRKARRIGAQPASIAMVQSSAGDGKFSYGPVKRDDTLWNIAKQMRPSGEVSVHQVMMAILDQNPEAFYDNNINNLKAGYVLRVDNESAFTQLSNNEARRESIKQLRSWQEAKQGKASAAAKRPLAGKADDTEPGVMTAADSADGSAGPRLKLVAPDSRDVSITSEGLSAVGVPGAEQSAGMGDDIAVAMETVEAVKQENSELRSRLDALEDQLSSMQRLVTLKDDEMAVIQGKSITPSEQALETGTEKGSTDTQGASSIPPSPPQAIESTDVLASLLGDPMVLVFVVGGVLVVLIVVWIIRKRRSGGSDFNDDAIEQETPFVMPDVKSGVSKKGVDVANAGIVNEVVPDSGVSISQTETDEIDAMSEADVYLAYRRYDKAAELLKSAIQDEPGRNDLKLKLLEVYSVAENKDDFISVAEEVRDAMESADWGRVVKMGRVLAPEHALFSDGSVNEDMQDFSGLSDDLDLGGLDDLESQISDMDFNVDIPSESEMESGVQIEHEIEFESGLAPMSKAEESGSMMDLAVDTLDDNSLDFDGGFDDVVDSGPGLIKEEKLEGITSDSGSELDAALEVIDDGILDFESGLAEAVAVADNSDVSLGDKLEFVDESIQEFESSLDDLEIDEQTSAAEDDLGLIEADQIEDQFESIKKDDDLKLDADMDWLSDIDDEVSDDLGSIDSAFADIDEDDFQSGDDEMDTKLDLAKAYIDMGDQESANTILDEVESNGSDEQKSQAQALKSQAR